MVLNLWIILLDVLEYEDANNDFERRFFFYKFRKISKNLLTPKKTSIPSGYITRVYFVIK